MIDALLGPLMPYVVTVVSGVVVYLFGYRKAHKEHRNAKVAQRLEDVKKAQEVRDEVDALDDIGLAERAQQWVRDNK